MKFAASRTLPLWLTVLSAAALTGCGGGDTDDTAAAAVGTTHTAAVDFNRESDYGPGDRPGGAVLLGTPTPGASPAPPDVPTRRPVGNTFDERAAALPADGAARTRQGLYLSRVRAERAESEHPGGAVWIDAGCCPAALGGDDLAVMIAFATQAALNLDAEAPFFVVGSDLRAAARLTDRLTDSGVAHAYVVTP
jgi:hypothetical protein